MIFSVPCDTGEFYNSKSGSCDPCPRNEYSDDVGGTSCLPCPGDTVTPRVGSRKQTDCISPAGIHNLASSLVSFSISDKSEDLHDYEVSVRLGLFQDILPVHLSLQRYAR